ncbi:hypothetical protein AKO1_010419 [Acrasis kona]|uniref:Uncharacterized protein n=1 Tax=Acrasis kona TaxID=1008807 RepID=A0AAW2ZKP9_9EUKA
MCPMVIMHLLLVPLSPDEFHPHVFSGISFNRVSQNNKIYIHDPKPEWRNLLLNNCGADMDCDGLKNVVLKDLDGSLLSGNGVGGSLVSNYPGIVDSSKCSLVSEMNAYQCSNQVDYELMVLESMDADTFDRRCGPVNVSANTHTYYINGPMDHFWDFDYASQKRLSTFFGATIVNKKYKVSFAGTPPRELNVYLLSSTNDSVVVAQKSVSLAIKYSTPESLLVSVNGANVPDSGSSDNKGDSYVPVDFIDLKNETGTNVYDYRTRTLYLVVRSGDVVRISTKPTIQVTMRIQLSFDDFFSSGNSKQFVNNLALSLGIDPSLIRIVDITRGSVIVNFHIASPSADATPFFTNVVKNITTQVSRGSLNVGWPILDMSLRVSIPTDTNSSSNSTNPFMSTFVYSSPYNNSGASFNYVALIVCLVVFVLLFVVVISVLIIIFVVCYKKRTVKIVQGDLPSDFAFEGDADKCINNDQVDEDEFDNLKSTQETIVLPPLRGYYNILQQNQENQQRAAEWNERRKTTRGSPNLEEENNETVQ